MPNGCPSTRDHERISAPGIVPSERLRQFTAIGTIADDVIWQADEGDFKPFRRRVRYMEAQPVSVQDVKTLLRLTSAPNWGYHLRRGLVQLNPADVDALRQSMLPEVTDGLPST